LHNCRKDTTRAQQKDDVDEEEGMKLPMLISCWNK
jgi:hypothetical protein